jgi:UDP-N-acetylglucosamine 2-epimerase (non-hydrolysing)
VVDSGFGQLVGTDPDQVVAATSALLRDEAAYHRMISGTNPFGDGHAAERIVQAIVERFELSMPTSIAVGGI